MDTNPLANAKLLGWTDKALDAIWRTLRPGDQIGRVTKEWIEITRLKVKMRAYNDGAAQPWRRIWKNTE